MNPIIPSHDARAMLEVRGVRKHYDGVAALRDAGLRVRQGEIHALLGENGAGKSTLIKVLTGLVIPDGGEIVLDGEPARFHSVKTANEAGVVALYQEIAIVPTLTVAENIGLSGHSPHRFGIVDWKTIRGRARTQLDRLGQSIPLDRLAGSLSPMQQTMVALARALNHRAKVLILDEPTAALTEAEVSTLFGILRQLRDEGVAIVYVSHRLEEVIALCDRYTIMRNGATVESGDIADVTENDIIRAMVGRDPDALYPAKSSARRQTVLAVAGLGGRRVRHATFEAHAGEVVGIGGLAGSGRSELLRLLVGAQRRSTGHVQVSGRTVPADSVAAAIEAGIAYVPEERRAQGVVLDASILDNVATANLGLVSRAGIVRESKAARLAADSIVELSIRATGVRQPVSELSGGNQQKVVLAKVLARSPRVLVVDEPTRGIDVGARAEIYRLVRALADAGAAVVVVSSDLAELIGISDRILTMHEGRINGVFDAAETDDAVLLSHFYGKAA